MQRTQSGQGVSAIVLTNSLHSTTNDYISICFLRVSSTSAQSGVLAEDFAETQGYHCLLIHQRRPASTSMPTRSRQSRGEDTPCDRIAKSQATRNTVTMIAFWRTMKPQDYLNHVFKPAVHAMGSTLPYSKGQRGLSAS